MERRNAIAIGVIVVVAAVSGVFLVGGEGLMGSFQRVNIGRINQRTTEVQDYGDMPITQRDIGLRQESRMNSYLFDTPNEKNELVVGTEVIAMEPGWDNQVGFKGTITVVHEDGTYDVNSPTNFIMKDVKKSGLAIFSKHPSSVTQGSKIIYKAPENDKSIPPGAYFLGTVVSSVGSKAVVPKEPMDADSINILVDVSTQAWMLLE